MDNTELQDPASRVEPHEPVGLLPAGLVLILVLAAVGATAAAAITYFDSRQGQSERSALLCLAKLEAISDQSLARLIIANQRNDQERAELAVEGLQRVSDALGNIQTACPDFDFNTVPLSVSDFTQPTTTPAPSEAEDTSSVDAVEEDVPVVRASGPTQVGSTVRVSPAGREILPAPSPPASAPQPPQPPPQRSEPSDGVLEGLLGDACDLTPVIC